jgi:hypothetical protein
MSESVRLKLRLGRKTLIDVTRDNPITPDAAGQSTKPGINMVLALALAWVVYDTSYWNRFLPDRNVVVEESAQVLFVVSSDMSPGQGQASISQKVDRYCDERGIEKRRLEAGQDVSGAEPWLQSMAEIGYGQAPCLVFRSVNGKLDVIPMPDSIDSVIEEIGGRL